MLNKTLKREMGGKWLIKKIPFYFKKLLKLIKDLFYKQNILYAKGTHIITGYPGAGKSLLMSHIINNVDKSKYFWLCNLKEYKQENVYYFNLEDVFSDKVQMKKFPTKDAMGRKLYGVIFDEINLSFNKRDNRSREYNSLFIGLMEFLVSRRHQGIDRVYFIGQKLELQDTQLMSIFQYQHDIYNKKESYLYYYRRYLLSPLYEKIRHYKYEDDRKFFKGFYKIPKYVKIVNLYKSIEDEFLPYEELKIKFDLFDLELYDTHVLKQDYDKLEEVKIK